ncbi:olfactory receptor 49-like [Gopherus evgoodei]|uniref:olfactory receptor 49-like n=1 Tax=Gopherus evgoodei TaxID=1825980 RepID=UPI0011CF3604|nr:olfactory receptor 49-like [Gopherus evgoodei]
MVDRDWGNQTAITEFIILGFRDLPDLQILPFLMFQVIYMATVAGNTLIVVLIVADLHFHTPMYFFLGNLSCLETCYTSAIQPRLLSSLLTGDRTISASGCIIQMYFFGSLLIFCGPNETDHFYCDCIPLMELSCSDTHLVILLAFIIASIFTLTPFLLTLTSYMCIITTILRIPSTTGRQKAFSICSSHLIVVTIFYGSIMIVYLLLKHDTLRDLNKVLSLCYTVLTPLVNPLIYSLRNREVKEALCNAVSKYLVFTKCAETPRE